MSVESIKISHHAPSKDPLSHERIESLHRKDRTAFLATHPSGVCVRIDSQRGIVGGASDVHQLTELFDSLTRDNFVDKSEEFVVKGGKRKTLGELHDDALLEKSPEEKEIRLRRLQEALLAQLVKIKLERVNGLQSDLKSLMSDYKASNEYKNEKFAALIQRAGTDGFVDVARQKSLKEKLKNEGFESASKDFADTLETISGELSLKIKKHRLCVEKGTPPTAKAVRSNEIGTGIVQIPIPIAAKAVQEEKRAAPQVLNEIVNFLNKDPVKKEAYSEIVMTALQMLSDVKRHAEQKKAKDEEINLQEKKEKELLLITQIANELAQKIPGLKISVSDLQIVYKHMESLSLDELRSYMLEVKNAFSKGIQYQPVKPGDADEFSESPLTRPLHSLNRRDAQQS